MPIFNSGKKYLPAMAFTLLAACDRVAAPLPLAADADAFGSTPATHVTTALNKQVLETLPFADRDDFEDAMRGLIARPEALTIAGPNGGVAWEPASYDFIAGDAPASVNPSLWRQAQLNNIHGLFKVTDGVYQIRGFDLANMSLIEGARGWIVVDPLTNNQTAAAAINFAFEHLPAKPISAVLFTHSHIDHFGGVLGALEAAQTDIAEVRVIAPQGFLEEATSENMLAGPTMMRRSDYMYGGTLPRTERGHVGSGLGKGPSNGNVSILAPTESIDHTGQVLTIDGVEFVFQNVSGSEAPAEFTFYLPAHKAFCGAELVSRNMHNLYTLRGAKVRDALAWSGFIDEAKNMFAEADVYFASHHWPIWGRERIASFLEVQRDTYKYIHDQTLRLAYQGYTPGEIAEQIELPESLQQGFSNRGYYGTLRHNARAVYQRYFGWYDGNPANLDPLAPEQAAERYVGAMGGTDQVLALAQSAFDSGEYRWAATLLNHLVFAQPANTRAKALLARNYDQLGYQAESGPWRDIYLTGAQELRRGKPHSAVDLARGRDMIKYAARSNFFDVMAAQLNAQEAEGMEMTINFTFSDLNENHVLTLKNSVLHHRQAPADSNANATLRISHELFLDMVLGSVSIRELIFSDELAVDGSKIDLARFFALQDQAEAAFEMVLP
ncbi:MAG: alkyl sulfatase BDS1-like metallo-beta-lactamase superfamily hydrolase [Halieaceae bacterium]|jgi:alkyl sulfatase BDS1-like metallo-beta-lactamase superfamily hydrolase